MAQTIIEILNSGVEANYNDKFRKGNIIGLPDTGSVVAAGDIHGHRRNFERIKTFANLSENPDRHVILQEVIHGGAVDSAENCISYHVLFDVVRYKLEFPDNVHVLMGNHDTAFISNSQVMKDGKEMNRSMRLAIENEFKEKSSDVLDAISKLLFSQPLAVRTENRIWMSHSLPADIYIDKFDGQIMSRELTMEDIVRPGSAYLLTWGRNFGKEVLNRMAELFDANIFILGHQTQKQGWCKAAENLVIITSEHNHGCIALLELSKHYTVDQIIDSIVPLASIG